MILAVRTDTAVAELYLCKRSEGIVDQRSWQADNRLSRELLEYMHALLEVHNLDFSDLTGLIGYRGPGSFTGLRIGLTAANALAYATRVPVVGTTGTSWLKDGIAQLAQTKPDGQILPEYGGEANITHPRK